MVKTRLKFAGASDTGRVRTNNEDRWYADADRGFYLVVDGIGGQAAGEKAASIAVDRVRARLERMTGTTEQRVREAVAMANNEIVRQAHAHPEWTGMACVLTLAMLEDGTATIGHVGDSRLYQVRAGEIRKITHDHSPVGEREDNREISEAEAMRHPRRNEVYRDVGSAEHAPDDPEFIEVARIPFDAATALVLCSDGLSDQVPSDKIRQAVERNAGNPDVAVRELIDAANRAGGKDNVTVLVVEGDQFRAPETAAPVRPRRRVWPAILAAVAALAAGGYGGWQYARLRTPTPPGPRELVVGGNGGFPTIAAALADAKPGDTVYVSGGEYREQLLLKSGVAVVARPTREAILRAAPISGGPAVAATGVTGARLSGFSIQADAAMPLAAGIVLDSSQVEIEDTEISGAANGIELRASGDSRLIGNAVHDCTATGLLIAGPGHPWISHNSVQRNKGGGLIAREGAHPSLVGNIFDKNAVDLPPDMDAAAVREKNFFLEPPPRAGRSGTRGPVEGPRPPRAPQLEGPHARTPQGEKQ